MLSENSQLDSEEHKHSKHSKKYKINTTKCRSELDLLKQIISSVPHYVETVGNRGELTWFGLAVQDTDLPLPAGMIINRFPGALEAARKKALGENLQSMAKYYPLDYQFFPRTYLFPIDDKSLEEDMTAFSRFYIAKPTSGAH